MSDILCIYCSKLAVLPNCLIDCLEVCIYIYIFQLSTFCVQIALKLPLPSFILSGLIDKNTNPILWSVLFFVSFFLEDLNYVQTWRGMRTTRFQIVLQVLYIITTHLQLYQKLSVQDVLVNALPVLSIFIGFF